jgi:3-hydroxyisobutyrate dehydrogenase-like beta-hydroxyacid dehydrogenase
LAEIFKLELPVTETVNQILARADEKGWGAKDFAIISELVRGEVVLGHRKRRTLRV